ncbi:MAG: heavy-metal-associated domain-containing protein [Flavobacteriales bacterium]|nr:heavy-metal-associated domain-containing protein [Flavobacteriales bacterium]
MCEKTIETELVYTKGVKKVDVDLSTAAVSVTYDPRKTDADKLRAALTKLGYSADGTPGNASAFAKLPQCCQNEGCGKLPVKQ